MIVYTVKCQSCGHVADTIDHHAPCLVCDGGVQWFKMRQRDAGVDDLRRNFIKDKIAPDENPLQKAWMESPEVQADLKSGKKYIPSKSDDIAQHR